MAEPWTTGSVVVTGGTGLVGQGIVRAFLEKGASVAAIGSTAERARETEAALGTAGGRLLVARADLAEPGEAERVLAAIESALGPIAVLVNAAGRNFNRALSDLTGGEFDRIIGANLKSAVFMCRAAASSMAERGVGGRIIVITSGNYRYMRPDAALYCASKAALEMFVRGFALEYGRRGVTANAVAPGLVANIGNLDPGFLRVSDYYRDQAPTGRLATSGDIAAAILYLASEAAAAVTGETIVIDGGYSAGRCDFPRRNS